MLQIEEVVIKCIPKRGIKQVRIKLMHVSGRYRLRAHTESQCLVVIFNVHPSHSEAHGMRHVSR